MTGPTGGARGLPAKVELIQRKNGEEWHISFPSAVAEAMEFRKGEQRHGRSG
jgi:hypothetical protein